MGGYTNISDNIAESKRWLNYFLQHLHITQWSTKKLQISNVLFGSNAVGDVCKNVWC